MNVRYSSWRKNKKCGLNSENVHPIVLPNKSKISKLIVKWCHSDTAHSGRGMTLHEIRCNGFWVICRSSLVKSFTNVLYVVNSAEELGSRLWLTC